MKITHEGREFASQQNQSADTFIAAEEGGSSAEALAKAESGMAQMSEKFREKGADLYIPAE